MKLSLLAWNTTVAAGILGTFYHLYRVVLVLKPMDSLEPPWGVIGVAFIGGLWILLSLVTPKRWW